MPSPRPTTRPGPSASEIGSLETADPSSTTDTSRSSSSSSSSRPKDASMTPPTVDQREASPVEGWPRSSGLDGIHHATETLRIRDVPREKTRDRHGQGEDPQAGPGPGRMPAPAPASVSEISTLPSSLGGSDVISTVTPAMDEKASSRPDDGASATAHQEDEDAASTTHETAPAPAPASVPLLVRSGVTGQGAEAPSFVDASPRATTVDRNEDRPVSSGTAGALSPPSPVEVAPPDIVEPSRPQMSPPSIIGNGTRVPFGFSLEPDDRLVEALENPKDRLFVLRLEQDVIDFVKDSR